MIPLWVKLAVVLAALSAGFAGGWQTRTWRAAYQAQAAAEAQAKDFLRREKENYGAAEAHERVRVQMWVGSSARAVSEGGSDEPVGGDLLRAVVSSTRDSGVAFEVAECGVDGRVVCGGDLSGHLG